MIAGIWAVGKTRLLIGCGVAGALAIASGCVSSGQEATPVQPTSSVLDVTVNDTNAPRQSAPLGRSRDGFPDFSQPLTAANVQMSNDEAAALQAQLTELGMARSSGAISEAEYQRRLLELRKLAAEHGMDTQAQIVK
ncbi:MAG: SHOCT domain-containing protein [Rhizobium sp.]